MRAGAVSRSDPPSVTWERGQTGVDHRPVRPARARQSRSKPRNPLLGVLVFLSVPLAASVGTGSIVPILIALLLVLPVLVLGQRRRPAPVGSGQGVGLATPWRLALAVVVVTVLGSLAAVVLSLVWNGLGVGGSGGTLLEALLAVCVLAPCFSLGTLCGRWWSFSGSLPMLGLVALGPPQLALVALAATSCSLALGSLHRSSHARQRRCRTADHGASRRASAV
jgi:hypothetical protein